IDMVQIPYNLLDRAVEDAVLPLADKLGLGTLVMEPLATGALVKKAPAPEQIAPFLDHGLATWAQVCLKWILSDPRVSCVIPATRDAQHARDNAVVGQAGHWYDEKERESIAELIA